MRNGENSRQEIRPKEQQQEQEDIGKVPCLPKNATLKIQSRNARPPFERVDKSTPMARIVRPCTSPANSINWFMALSRTSLHTMAIKCDEAIYVHLPENSACQRYNVLFSNSWIMKQSKIWRSNPKISKAWIWQNHFMWSSYWSSPELSNSIRLRCSLRDPCSAQRSVLLFRKTAEATQSCWWCL